MNPELSLCGSDRRVEVGKMVRFRQHKLWGQTSLSPELCMTLIYDCRILAARACSLQVPWFSVRLIINWYCYLLLFWGVLDCLPLLFRG